MIEWFFNLSLFEYLITFLVVIIVIGGILALIMSAGE